MKDYKLSDVKEICKTHGEIAGLDCYGCELFNGINCDILDKQDPSSWEIDNDKERDD